MTSEIQPIDLIAMPELVRLTDEVRASNWPVALQRNHETVAVLIPVKRAARPRRTNTPTDAEIQAFLSSAGSWQGIVDTEKLKLDIYESRGIFSRPPVEV